MSWKDENADSSQDGELIKTDFLLQPRNEGSLPLFPFVALLASTATLEKP